MKIEIKKSVKPIKYKSAIIKLEEKLEQVKENKSNEFIKWKKFSSLGIKWKKSNNTN